MEKAHIQLSAIAPHWSKRSRIAWFLVIAAIFIAWSAAYYPGNFFSDFLEQVDSFYSGTHKVYICASDYSIDYVTAEGLSTHHPIVVTMLYGSVLRFGEMICSQEIGLFLCAVLTSLLSAYAMSTLACYLSKHIGNDAIRLFSTVISVALPAVLYQATTCGKDALFSAVFVLWLIAVAEMRKQEEVSWKLSAMVAFLGVACSFTRNAGMLICVLTMVALFAKRFMKKRNRTQITIATLCPLVATCLLSVICSVAGVVSDGMREAGGMLYYQTAVYTSEHADEQSDSEKEAIDRVLEYDRIAAASESAHDCIDPVKCLFRSDTATATDLLGYLGVYFQEGLRHPDTYLRAWWYIQSHYLNMQEISTNAYPYTKYELSDAQKEKLLSLSGIDDFDEKKMNLIPYTSYTLLYEQGDAPTAIAPPDYDKSTPWSVLNHIEIGNQTTRYLADSYMMGVTNVFFPLMTSLSYLLLAIIGAIVAVTRRKEAKWVFVPLIVYLAYLASCPVVCMRYIALFVFLAPWLVSEVLALLERVLNDIEGRRKVHTKK